MEWIMVLPSHCDQESWGKRYVVILLSPCFCSYIWKLLGPLGWSPWILPNHLGGGLAGQKVAEKTKEKRARIQKRMKSVMFSWFLNEKKQTLLTTQHFSCFPGFELVFFFFGHSFWPARPPGWWAWLVGPGTWPGPRRISWLEPWGGLRRQLAGAFAGQKEWPKKKAKNELKSRKALKVLCFHCF